MNITPKVRRDLQVAPSQEEGISYVDVTDPQTGETLRLYDYEWLVAQQMDGKRSFDDVAAWVTSQFDDWHPSPEDLEVYADRLVELNLAVKEPAGARIELVPDEEEPAPRIVPAPVQMTAASDRLTPREVDAVPGEEPRPVGMAEPDEEEEEDGHMSVEISVSSPMPEEEKRAPMPEALPEPPRPAPPLFAEPPVSRPQPAPPMPPPVVEPTPPPMASRETRPAPLPERPPMIRDLPRIEETPAPVLRPTTLPASSDPPPRRRLFLPMMLVVLFVAAAGGGVWIYQNMIGPSSSAVAVVTHKVEAPTTMTRYYGEPAKLKRSEPVVVTVEREGTAVNVAAAGTEVQAGDPLVTLDSYAALAKQLDDVRAREKYYQGKNDQRKVAEKQRLIAQLEEKIKGTRVLAPSGGTVSEVKVNVGAAVKPGDVALRLVDSRVLAEFSLPVEEAAALKRGQTVKIEAATGAPGATPVDARIVAIKEGAVTIEPLPSASALKVGDEIRLVKNQISNVITIPVAAISKSTSGADQVFVHEAGVARARPVLISERDGSNVLVTNGVNPGEEIVTMSSAPLQDGQKISTGPTP